MIYGCSTLNLEMKSLLLTMVTVVLVVMMIVVVTMVMVVTATEADETKFLNRVALKRMGLW
jgi:flagellar basal body-associated protein FliL